MPVVLGDYVELQRGTTYKSAMLGQAGPVLLGLGSIARNGGFKGNNLKTYGGPCDPRHLVRPGEIYVSLKDVTQSADLLGAVARLPPYIPLGRLTQDTVKLVFKKEDASRTYLYWLLRTPQYREYCLAHSTGTTNLGLARDDFLKFEVPPLTREREWIVRLVQTIEDKVELNRRLNKALEGMAQAIFKDWFIDFGPTRRKIAGAVDPVAIIGGLIPDAARAREITALFPDALGDDGMPEGWREKPLDQSLILQRGFDLPKTTRTDGCYPVIAASGPNGTHDEFKVRGPGVCTGRSGVLGGVFFVREDFWPLNTSLWIKDYPNSTPLYAFYLLRTLDLLALNGGSAVPTLNRNHVHQIPVVTPSMSVIHEFERLVTLIYDRIGSAEAESCTLAETCDYLLPKLISGEVRVHDAEQAMAGIA